VLGIRIKAKVLLVESHLTGAKILLLSKVRQSSVFGIWIKAKVPPVEPYLTQAKILFLRKVKQNIVGDPEVYK
jgi:hypothetical protein